MTSGRLIACTLICMRLGFFRSLIAASLVLLGLTGCGAARPHQIHIAVIALTGGEAYWVDFQHAVASKAALYGYDVSFAAPQSEMDYKTQADMVRQAIIRRVDGIIVAPQHQLVLASVLRSAHEAGIPVIVAGMTIALPSNEYAASIQLNNREMGVLAAEKVINLLHGKGTAAVIGVSPTLEVTSEREHAFEQELEQRSKIHVVATKYGLSDWARSRQATLDALEEAPPGHPVTAVFTSDEFSTLGALGGLRSLKNRPVFVGVGQEPDTINALRHGEIDGLVVSSPQQLGTAAIETMHAVLDHRPYEKTQVEPVRLIEGSSPVSEP